MQLKCKARWFIWRLFMNNSAVNAGRIHSSFGTDLKVMPSCNRNGKLRSQARRTSAKVGAGLLS